MIDRWKRVVPPIAGVVFVACFVTALFVEDETPDSGASGARVIAYYQSHHDQTLVSLALLAYGALAAVVFYAGVASYLRRRGADLLATLTVVGAAIFAVGIGIAAGTAFMLTDKTDRLSDAAAQALNQVSEDVFFITMFGGLALATLAMGISMLRTMAMPKALGIVTVVVGVVAISGIGAWFAFMATGPLTLVIAGYLYQRMGQPDSITLPDVDVPPQREKPVRARKTAKASTPES